MEVPGNLGYIFLGDGSLEFVRSPLDFVAKRRETHGDVFKARLLNKPFIFLTSNRAVHELLQCQASCFTLAYKFYFKEMFGDVLLFMEGDSWKEARELMETVFNHQLVNRTMELSKRLIQEHMQQLETNGTVVIYKFFKELATRLSIALFLGHDIGTDLASEISSHMTYHWRGVISVPMAINLPKSSWKSGYGRALEAKGKLLRVIKEQLSNGPSTIASDMSDVFRETAADQLLLFVSALIPKAMASLLTSAVIELSKSNNVRWQGEVREDTTAAEEILLEVQRLWPPFLGGARICTMECEIAGYLIPEGTHVTYISHSANRDKAVFAEPNNFRPERWKNENVLDREKVWTLGGGARNCIGKCLTNSLLKECLGELCKRYKWELLPGQDLSYKTLPICRPKHDIQATFIKHTAPQ